MSLSSDYSPALLEDAPTATASSSASVQNSQSLLPVSILTLSASAVLAFDLYWQKKSHGNFTLYRERSHPLLQTDLDRLKDRGVDTLYIVSGDASQYRAYLQEHVLTDKNIPAIRRFQVLKEAARAVFVDSFHSKDVGTSLEVTMSLGQQMVETLCSSEVALCDVFQVMAHDYGTFTHAMNVASYALLFAKGLGIHDSQQLFRICQGGMLHDFGKQFVPRRILDKKNPLNEQELRLMREHPVAGFVQLSSRVGLDWSQLMMVYQHHERCDGRGYPGAMTRREIHDHAQICSIADVTDAMTRDRPYRKAQSLPQVIEYFQTQSGRAFDKEMTECWISMLAHK